MEESHYVIEKLGEYHRLLIQLQEAMPNKRKAVETYRQSSQIQSAKEAYAELENLKEKLLDAVRGLRLLFLECDMADGAAFCTKLYGAVKAFHLLTPDYAKLTAAMQQLAGYIPQEEAANSRTIGRLMNHVKMGYFPTDLEHVDRIKSALVFPAGRVNLLDKTTPRLIQFHTFKMP